MSTAHTFHPTASTAALLTSLANELGPRDALSREAFRIARKLNRVHPRSLEDRAAGLLAALLSATDSGVPYDDDLTLDSHFDD